MIDKKKGDRKSLDSYAISLEEPNTLLSSKVMPMIMEKITFAWVLREATFFVN